jgi:glycosyltransferase involved in cell wall biosynthesis
VENPRALADTIAALHATPKKILTQLQSGDRAASAVSWQSVAKQVTRVYNSLK